MARTRSGASSKHNSNEKNDTTKPSKNKQIISKQFKKDKTKRLSVRLRQMKSSEILNLTSESVNNEKENSILLNSGNSITQMRHTKKNEKNYKVNLSRTEINDLEAESSVAVPSEFQDNEQEFSISVDSGNSSKQNRRTRSTAKSQLSKIKNDLKFDWNVSSVLSVSQDNESENSIVMDSGNSIAQKRHTRNTAKVLSRTKSDDLESDSSVIFPLASQEEQKFQSKITHKSVVKEKSLVKKDDNAVKVSNPKQDSAKKINDIQQSISIESISSESSVSEKSRSLSVVQNKRSSDDSYSPIENKIMKRLPKSKNYIATYEKENIVADHQQTPLNSKFKSNRLSLRKVLSQSFNNIAVDKDDDDDFKSPVSHKVLKSKKKHNEDSNKKENLKEPNEKITKSLLKLNPMITNENDDSDIYEFQSSQTSTSEKEDTFIKQLEKEGKIVIKHRRRNKIKETAAKKKYIKSSRVWHGIEKNLGIFRHKATNKTTKKNDTQTQSMHPYKTSNKIENVAAVKTGSIKNVKFDNEIKIISEAQTTDDVKSTTTKELTTVNDTINTTVRSQTNNSILSINNNQQPSINESIKQNNNLNTTELHQTIRTPQNRRTLSKTELLEYAKNFVKNQTKSSTPIANKQRAKENDELLSPILLSSPWRITSLKNLSLSRTKNPETNAQLNESSITTIKNVSNVENIFPNNFEPKDAENKSKMIMRPTPAINTTATTTSKMNLMDNRHKVSPVSAAQRNPLKQINVLEVVNLPSISISDQKSLKLSSILSETVEFDKKNTNTLNVANDSVSNYFGFDEIDKEIEENKSDNDEKNTKIVTVNLQKAKFKRKLKNLKKLLPQPEHLSIIKNNNTKKIPSIFDDPSNTKKQANIREMLSSTTKSNATKMVVESFVATESSDEDPPKKITIPDEKTIVNFDDYDDSNGDNTVLTTDNLFNDPIEPETSLDATKVKRTYSRRSKTKLKKYFILFSDESDEENERQETSDEKKKRKGRKKKEHDHKDDKPQLDKFYDEFKSVCDEAENYELVTEIETSPLEP